MLGCFGSKHTSCSLEPRILRIWQISQQSGDFFDVGDTEKSPKGTSLLIFGLRKFQNTRNFIAKKTDL
jgi:hypothetical protein